MMWTYRVLCDAQNRYSIREVFCEEDGSIISYGQHPIASLGASLDELRQEMTWIQEALASPVLNVTDIEAELATSPVAIETEDKQNIALEQLRRELDLSLETDTPSDMKIETNH